MSPSRAERWLRWIVWSAGLVAFALVLAQADLRAATDILIAGGPLLALGALPYLAQLGLDALCWRTLLAALGRRVAWRRLLAIRLSTEAVLMSMPGGAFLGETLKPYLLARTDRVPAAETVATIAVKKCMLVFAEVLYLAVALTLGAALYAQHSIALTGTHLLPWLVAAAIALLLIVGTGMALAFTHGALGDRLHRALVRLPWPRVRRWLEARRAPFADADAAFATLAAAPRSRLAAAQAALIGAWFVETAETWLLLHLLGIDLPIVTVLAMEAAVVFVRNLAFFLPAGLGVQDAGYLGFLGAFGIASPAAAAFVLGKRTKELFWILAGYLTLVVLDGRRAAHATTTGLTAPASTAEMST
ncbi:MAG: lysylphosphatidylglycerol synthase domain-containing protein [Deltaproteobacteria bacterium]|nr:lysylphosphatidylglycerol synthase domain-containing protein [Deltaproteobacteria bacterium]